MQTALTDAEIQHLLDTVKPIEEWNRLIPDLPAGLAYPDAAWLEVHFGEMLDNLTARLVCAARAEDGDAVDVASVRAHWTHGYRVYGTKNNHIADQATGAGLLHWTDPRFGAGGRVTTEVAAVLRRLDAAVGERMGQPADDDRYTSGVIIDPAAPVEHWWRATELTFGYPPTDAEIAAMKRSRDFTTIKRDTSPEGLVVNAMHSADVRRILAALEAL